DERDEAEDQGNPEPPEPEQYPRAKYLFDLFELLAERGVAPFSSHRVRYSPPEVKLDWTKLPRRLAYLAAPAAKWGRYQFYEQLDELADRITPEEVSELEAVAHRLRSTGDEKLAYEWTSAHSYVEHP